MFNFMRETIRKFRNADEINLNLNWFITENLELKWRNIGGVKVLTLLQNRTLSEIVETTFYKLSPDNWW